MGGGNSNIKVTRLKDFLPGEESFVITGNPGTYILLLFLPQRENIRVGSLGEAAFGPGWYAYVGSAMGGLGGRISRHLRREKKIHWHIDYFLKVGILKEIIIIESRRKIECLVSAGLAETIPGAINRFGSSDCSCATHLYFAPVKEQLGDAVDGVLRRINIDP